MLRKIHLEAVHITTWRQQGAAADSDRRPVSMMAISNSRRLPYETVRRHSSRLVERGLWVRADRNGLIVPVAALRDMTAEAGPVVQLILGFMQELCASDLEV